MKHQTEENIPPDPHYFETSLIFLWQFLRFVCFCVAELTETNEFSGGPILATRFIQASHRNVSVL